MTDSIEGAYPPKQWTVTKEVVCLVCVHTHRQKRPYRIWISETAAACDDGFGRWAGRFSDGVSCCRSSIISFHLKILNFQINIFVQLVTIHRRWCLRFVVEQHFVFCFFWLQEKKRTNEKHDPLGVQSPARTFLPVKKKLIRKLICARKLVISFGSK